MVLQFAAVLGTPYMAFSKHFPVFFTGKGKTIPLETWTGPEGSRRLALPDLKTVGTGWW
jgi:hypothetical protein